MQWTPEHIQFLIQNQNLSIKTIAKKLDRTYRSISQKRHKLQLPNGNRSKLKTNLSTRQTEILNGLLLSDGWLSKTKDGHNYNFKLKSITQEFINNVKNNLSFQWCKDYIIPSKIDKRGYKYKKSYTCISRTDQTITKLYPQWYQNNIKIIPKNLQLTPLTVLHWFYGDGSTSFRPKHKNITILTLCTNNFTYQECEFLLTLFIDLNIRFHIQSTYRLKEAFTLVTTRINDVQNFFDYIGECTIKDFQYKWKIPYYKEL